MTPMECPNGCDLKGNPIPENFRDVWYPPGATHFSRAIANYDWYKDRTVSWSCPDCDALWARSSGEKEPPFLQTIVTDFSEE